MKKPSWMIRFAAGIVGLFFILISESTLLIPLIPGIGLITWAITGNFWEGRR